MRGGRDQRHRHVLIGLSLFVALGFSCSGHNPATDDDLYARASAAFRRADYRTAQSLAEQGNAAAGKEPQSIRSWRFRLLQADALIYLGRTKDSLALLEAQPPEGPEFAEVRSRSRTVRAKALYPSGRLKEAAAALDDGEAIAAGSHLNSLLPEIKILRYSLLEALNQPEQAEAALREGLRLAQEQKDSYWEGRALNNLGYSRLRRSRYDEAIPILVRAEEAFQKIGAPLLASGVQVNIAICATRLGDFDRALSSYGRAIEIQEREGNKPFLQASLGEVGSIYSLKLDNAKAISYYQRALTLALEINNVRDAAKWAGNLATSLANLGNWDEAEKFNNQARDLKQRLNDADAQARIQLTSALIAAGRGKNEIAEKLYQDVIAAAKKPGAIADTIGFAWDAHAGLAQLHRSSGNHKKAAEEFEAALRMVESDQTELSAADYKITFLARVIRFYQNYVDALIDRNEYDKALQIAESSRARVLVEKLGRSRAGQAQRVSAPVDYVRAAKQSNTVILSYWLGPKRSFLWAITPANRQLFTLPPRDEIESLVKSYLEFVHNLRDPLENAQPAAERLYETLLGPVRALIPSGARVLIVPDGALHNLNFEMLPVPGSPPHYWIEDVVLSIAPSMAVRLDGDSAADLKSILIIGNPESAGEDYPKLPNAGDEMRSVQTRMASLEKTVYEGARADPDAYRSSDPKQFSVIHFAAHASANSEAPMESAIILSPGEDTFKLYARDVAQSPLQAELVTISACRGAGARVYSGEGLVGFTWAFLHAGARHVIAGLWDVTDRSTAQLMDKLYESLGAQKSPARALRDAKLTLIHSGSNFRKPYYWAPFQIYLGSGADSTR